MANPLTDGGWGKTGDNPLGSATPNARRRAYGPAFNSYFQDRLNRLGGLQPNRGNHSPVYKNGNNVAQEEAAATDDWQNMPHEAASKFGQVDYEPAQTAALPHEATGQSAPAYPAEAPQAVPPPSLLSQAPKVPDTNFSSTNPAFRTAAGMTDPATLPVVTSPAPSAAPTRLGGVSLDPQGPQLYAGPAATPPPATGPVRTPDGAIRAFAGAENDTARFGPKLSGTGSLADVTAAATQPPISTPPSVVPTPPAPAVADTTPTPAPVANTPSAPAATPGNDAPGGLNDQLFQAAQAQGVAANAKKASDDLFAKERGAGPGPANWNAPLAAPAASVVDSSNQMVAPTPPYSPAATPNNPDDTDEDPLNTNKKKSAVASDY